MTNNHHYIYEESNNGSVQVTEVELRTATVVDPGAWKSRVWLVGTKAL